MVPSNFEGLVGYRTLRDEGQVPLKASDCVFGRVFQASVCIAHMASTDSVISVYFAMPPSLKWRVKLGSDRCTEWSSLCFVWGVCWIASTFVGCDWCIICIKALLLSLFHCCKECMTSTQPRVCITYSCWKLSFVRNGATSDSHKYRLKLHSLSSANC